MDLQRQIWIAHQKPTEAPKQLHKKHRGKHLIELVKAKLQMNKFVWFRLISMNLDIKFQECIMESWWCNGKIKLHNATRIWSTKRRNRIDWTTSESNWKSIENDTTQRFWISINGWCCFMSFGESCSAPISGQHTCSITSRCKN